MTRGIRNCNPLNIRISDIPWRGKVAKEKNTDGSFEQFVSMFYGFRAAIMNIRTYIIAYRCNTIAKIVDRWAPETDNNNTASYIRHVAQYTNIQPDECITSEDIRLLYIIRAMAIIESGEKITSFFDDLKTAFDSVVHSD